MSGCQIIRCTRRGTEPTRTHQRCVGRAVEIGHKVQGISVQVIGQDSRPIDSAGSHSERERVMVLASEPCTECGGWGHLLTQGDGKCTQCRGTGIDIGVAVLAGYEGDCEACAGTGVCRACAGTGVRPALDGAGGVD